MAFVRTFTVTVSGGKYFIDSVQQPTINIAEGGLYKFDLSDSSNEGYNFRILPIGSNINNSTGFAISLDEITTQKELEIINRILKFRENSDEKSKKSASDVLDC